MLYSPKVSVVIPVYNGSNYLEEAIDSALTQTYKNIEIIVVNDGSDDSGRTERIAKSYGNKIRYYKKENGGVASALNLGVKKMKGRYFSWLSHDDLYYPDKIKKQIKFLRKLKDKNVILYGDYEYINSSRKVIEKTVIKKRIKCVNYKKVFLKKMINGLTLLIPKPVLEEGMPFDEEKKYTQDYDMWYRLMLLGHKFVYLNHCGSMTRLHRNQDSSAGKSREEADLFWINIVKSYKKAFTDVFQSDRDFMIYSYLALRYSDHEKTKKYLNKELMKDELYDILDIYDNFKFNH